MNNLVTYQNEFCDKESVDTFEEGRILLLDELRARGILKLVKDAEKTDRSDEMRGHLIDVGCGVGTLTKWLAEHFESTTGIDSSLEKIRRAKEANTSRNTEFVVGKAEKLPADDKSADVITATFVIFFTDVNAFVSECLRVLKDGGIAVFWGDFWSSACHVDGKISNYPDATHLIQEMNRELLEIARKKSHPEFHIYDNHETLFKEIKVTEKKSLVSDYMEIDMSLAQLKKRQLTIPFNRVLGQKEPIHSFAKKLKVLWKKEDIPDEDIKLRMSVKAFPIVLKK